MPGDGRRWWTWGAAALLAAAGALAYARSFTVPFQFDDLPNLVEPAHVHVVRLDWAALAPLLRGVRPLAFLTFGLNHWAGGLAPFGWHAVNLAIHVGAALLAFLLAGEILLRLGWEDEGRRASAALLTALLFLLHPVQTQAVTYLVQRMASMAGLLVLLCAWLWFRGRRAGRPAGWMAGAGLAWVAAVLTKENALVFPAVLAGAEALLSDDLPAWLRRHRLRVAAAAAGALAVGGWMVARYWDTIQSEQVRFGLSVGERLLTQPRILGLYLSLLLWPLPSRLRVDYDFPPSHGLLDPPTTALALALLVAAVVLAWRVRRRWPLVTLAVLWFLGCLSVENSFLPVDLVFEQRLYLPSFGPFLLAGALAVQALGERPRWLWAAAAPLLLLLGLGTDRRNQVWNTPEALHAQVVADAPGNTRSLLTVGKEALARGDLATAERSFQAVLAKEPRSVPALGNLGNVARERGDRALAERWYRQALAVSPYDPAPLEGLGVVLAEQGRVVEAEHQFRTILMAEPANVRALTDMGTLRAQQGDHQGALGWFQRAAQADPASAYPLTAWGWTLHAMGRSAEALPLLTRARSMDPRNPDTLRLLGDCQLRLGRKAEAAEAWRALLALNPRAAGIHFQLGNLAIEAGDLAGAEREYLAEVALGPHSGALNNLGNLAAQRDPARARAWFEQALRVDPGNAQAAANLKAVGGR